MNNLPCINCLTYPICQNQYNELDYMFESRTNLQRKCTLLNKFLKGVKYLDLLEARDEIEQFHSYFKGKI